MRQFQVPQFIMVEDRIIGPLTLKQFLYLLGAAGVLLLGWFFLPTVLFVLISLPLAGLFAALAFAKIHGREFPIVFVNAINYYLKPRLYLWRQVAPKKKGELSQVSDRGGASPGAPKLTEGKLKDLSWTLDMKGRPDRG